MFHCRLIISILFRCQKILIEKDVNLINILTSKDANIFENNINITVGITAIQLAFVDLLKTIQIAPNHMIGYSIGEVACAYSDGALSVEQAILCSYFIGLASKTQKTESGLTKNLRKVIPSPKKRSAVWIATTEDVELSRTCSAEYLVHSLSCPTILQRPIPKDAVVIEIAPHGHLQSLLKNAFSEDIVTMSLAQRDSHDNIQHVLMAMGELYLHGANPRMEFLYPQIEFPVSRGTPMIAPLIKWDHSFDWFITKFESQEKIKSGERTVTVLLSDEEMEYVAGHVIDGK